MAKAKEYRSMKPEEVVEIMRKSQPGKLEINIIRDFIPALAQTAKTSDKKLFGKLIDAYLSSIAKTRDQKRKSRYLLYDFRQTVEFAGSLCKIAEDNYGAAGAFDMLLSHIFRYKLN